MSADDQKEPCGMKCHDVHVLFCELLDDDTSPSRAAEIQAMIAECPECFGRLQSEREVRELVRRCAHSTQAPDQLRQRIVRSISVTYTETRFF